MAYEYLWVRDDGSKTIDPWEVVDDYKLLKCEKCRIEKPA